MKNLYSNSTKPWGQTTIKLVDANGKAKKLFHTNFLWKFLKKKYHIDLIIPFVTGYWSSSAIKLNTIPTRGKEKIADLIGGSDTTPVSAIAIGIGTASGTALGSEITTNGGQRGAATVTNSTTTSANDTVQWVKTFTFTGSFAITEEGLFDNNTSGGIMLASQSFSVINVISTDTLQITHKVIIA